MFSQGVFSIELLSRLIILTSEEPSSFFMTHRYVPLALSDVKYARFPCKSWSRLRRGGLNVDPVEHRYWKIWSQSSAICCREIFLPPIPPPAGSLLSRDRSQSRLKPRYSTMFKLAALSLIADTDQNGHNGYVFEIPDIGYFNIHQIVPLTTSTCAYRQGGS